MAYTVVQSLMEGAGFGAFSDYGTFDSVSEASKYDLQSGASLIATESIRELHEIFECAVVQTSDAELSACAEGYQSVEESSYYSSVFEEAEKKSGNKIILFLKKLCDRVMAFFINIGTKLSAFVHNYDKWYKKHEKEIAKGGSIKLDIKAWNSKKIGEVSRTMEKFVDQLHNDARELISYARDAVNNKMETEEFNRKVNDVVDGFAGTVAGGQTASPEFMAQLNSNLWKTFCADDKLKSQTVNLDFVAFGLAGAKTNAENIKKIQKKFNTAYKDVIKEVNDVIKNAEKEDKKGYTQYCHKITAAISKIQSMVNAYANCGYRAVIGIANESVRAGNKLIAHGKR